MSELLPCPFCGGCPAFIEGTDADGRFVAVGCDTCGAGSSQSYPLMDDARPSAASAWNKRIQPSRSTEARFAELEAAFRRGAYWRDENASLFLVNKAACDYADKISGPPEDTQA